MCLLEFPVDQRVVYQLFHHQGSSLAGPLNSLHVSLDQEPGSDLQVKLNLVTKNSIFFKYGILGKGFYEISCLEYFLTGIL